MHTHLEDYIASEEQELAEIYREDLQEDIAFAEDRCLEEFQELYQGDSAVAWSLIRNCVLFSESLDLKQFFQDCFSRLWEFDSEGMYWDQKLTLENYIEKKGGR